MSLVLDTVCWLTLYANLYFLSAGNPVLTKSLYFWLALGIFKPMTSRKIVEILSFFTLYYEKFARIDWLVMR